MTHLILRIMNNDGYIGKELTPIEIDAIRQTQATLSLEQMYLDSKDITKLKEIVRGDITREKYQNSLKEKYQVDEKR